MSVISIKRIAVIVLSFTTICSAAFIIMMHSALATKACVYSKDGMIVEYFTLSVALYPFTPDRLVLFNKLEAEFECQHPGVNVVLVDSKDAIDNYYKEDSEKQIGIKSVDADIYEIDTIFLTDFVELKKISPIELPSHDFAPEVVAAVTRDGLTYGVPHWLCGNFLFYRASDTAIRDVRSWEELISVLRSAMPGSAGSTRCRSMRDLLEKRKIWR